MNKAMYAFSGDPITYGHIDIVERASRAFDEVVVGIGVNPEKKYLFSLEERTEMAKRSLSHLPNVSVDSFSGLLVDYAYEHKIPVIVRGVRDGNDFNYEMLLHQVGESQKLGIDTFLIPARKELAHISSSVVKMIQKEQGMIHEYVPLYVKQCLESKVSGQYIVGVTGEVGAGKSYVGRRFEELGREKGVDVHNIELDDIGHQILGSLSEPVYADVRRKIADEFGSALLCADGSLDRKALADLVFNDKARLKALDDIMSTPILVRLRHEMQGKKGLLLLNSALIAESRASYLCNNNVVFVTVDRETQVERLSRRGYHDVEMGSRLNSQCSAGEKIERLEAQIAKHNQGTVWQIDNSGDADPGEIERVFDAVVAAGGLYGTS